MKSRRGKKASVVIDFLLGPRPVYDVNVKSVRAKERFSSRDRAEKRAAEVGCAGAHQVGLGFWSPCITDEDLNAHRGTKNRVTRVLRAAKRRPKKLSRLRPMNRGVENISGGGLVSAKDKA